MKKVTTLALLAAMILSTFSCGGGSAGDDETGFSQTGQFLCAGTDTAGAGHQFYRHKRIQIHLRSSLIF